MKSIIKLMPEALANQIAAGEVVQRPASVVKELLENSVDAGAKHVRLLVEEAGKKLIQVVDDGSGMSAADARMAFERHATSKIATLDDLFNIRTLGFRGEALASIAAVAQVELKTRQADEELGVLLELEGGRQAKSQPTPGPVGTSLAVRNLFFNVPARRNFLKANPTEFKHILDEFRHVALAYPDRHFELIHNSQTVHDLRPTDLSGRIRQLFPELAAEDLWPAQADGWLKVAGFVGAPAKGRTMRLDFFFINGRYIRSNYLHHAVRRAYDRLAPDNTHPFYLLLLEAPPNRVDINIHPTKSEVKFDEEAHAYDAVLQAVRRALDAKLTPFAEGTESVVVRAARPTPPSKSGGKPRAAERTTPRDFSGFLEDLKETPAKKTSALPVVTDEPVGPFVQLYHKYILIWMKGEARLLNRQAAHARVLYDRLTAAQKSGAATPAQRLLFPYVVKLNQEYSDETAAKLKQWGVEAKLLPDGALSISALPEAVAELLNVQRLEECLAELCAAPADRMALLLVYAAAVRPGKAMTDAEALMLLRQWVRLPEGHRAPDGSPTYFVLSAGDLAQKFKKS